MVNYSRIIGEVMVLMKKPSVSESPIWQGTRTCPGWDLAETEACGGGKVFLWFPLVYGEYLGIYGAEIRVRGVPRGPQAWGAPP